MAQSSAQISVMNAPEQQWMLEYIWLPISVTSSPPTSTFSPPSTLTSFVPQTYRACLNLAQLHMHYTQAVMLFPQIILWLTHFSYSDLCSNTVCSERAFLTPYLKENSSTLPLCFTFQKSMLTIIWHSKSLSFASIVCFI